MALLYHPEQGCLVRVAFEPGFREPEMVKRRLCVVLSPAISARGKVLTVVALSTTSPLRPMPYHAEIEIPFELPVGWERRCWVKGDMVNAVGFHRTDLIQLGKDATGRRVYQTAVLPPDTFQRVRRCVLHGLGLSSLTKQL